MKITQITSIGGAAGGLVFGLGEDNKIYYWSVTAGEWVLDTTV